MTTTPGSSRPEHRSRLPRLVPDRMEEEQRTLYRTITGGPRASGPSLFRIADDDGALLGPFGVMLHAPRIGTALQQVGLEIRYHSQFSDRAREIAILAVGAHWNSAYEAYAHEAVGRACGLTEPELEALADGRDPEFTDPVEDATWRLTIAMLAGDVDDETWARCVPPFTVAQVVELSTLVGYYATLALQMRVLRSDVVPMDPTSLGDVTSE